MCWSLAEGGWGGEGVQRGEGGRLEKGVDGGLKGGWGVGTRVSTVSCVIDSVNEMTQASGYFVSSELL